MYLGLIPSKKRSRQNRSYMSLNVKKSLLPLYGRKLNLELLEDRRLLSINIVGVTSAHDDFRFIAGNGLPAVQNTYTAQITGGTPTKVEFLLGGQDLQDTDPTGGWTAQFNMSSLTSDTELTVRAYQGTSVVDTYTHNVSMLRLPNWFHDSGGSFNTGTTFTATQDWSTGYQFDVTVDHLDLGFNTPSNWAFYVPGISQPLFDLANKHTGFVVQSDFELDSSPTGLVTSSGYQLEMWADVLGKRVYEDTISFSSSGSKSYQKSFPGGVEVSGSIAYGAEVDPHFSNSLLLDGISGTAYVDPSLSITIPLGEVRIPLVAVPGLADLVFSADATIGFQTAAGHAHMLSITPSITSGGLGIDTFEMDPALVASISGSANAQLLLGAGSVGATLTADLEQSLLSHYDKNVGWQNSAPGSLSLSASAHYDTLWGIGPQGKVDLFQFQVASWDFLSGTGSNPQYTGDVTSQSTAIVVSASASSTTVVPGDQIYISGSANYNPTGNQVLAATALLTFAGQTWTAPVSNGAYSRYITIPGNASSQSLTVAITDSTGLTGQASIAISVQGEAQIGSIWSAVVSSYSTYSRDGSQDISTYSSPGFLSFSPTQTGSLWGILHLEDISSTGTIKMVVRKPDGSEPWSYQWDNPYSGSGSWRWVDYGWSTVPQLDETGVWTFEWSYRPTGANHFTDIATSSFTYRYDFKEHLMATSVQPSSPWMWSNQTNTFYQDNADAFTWAEADNVSGSLDAKWNFYEPNGQLYKTTTYTVAAPPADQTFGWDRFYGWIGIAGNSAEQKCGQWHVDVLLKDAWGNYQNVYTDYFRILERPGQSPRVNLSLVTPNPLENSAVLLNVSATDNTYLDHVLLYWNDGAEHHIDWSNLISGSMSQSPSLGTFVAGTRVEYWATATDTSGNTFVTPHASFKVSTPTPMATINGTPATSPEGTPISLTSTVTDPDPVQQAAGFTYSWDVTKVHGATTTLHFATSASANFSFTPDDDGMYTVTLVATDSYGTSSAPATQTTTVTNMVPRFVQSWLLHTPFDPTTQDTVLYMGTGQYGNELFSEAEPFQGNIFYSVINAGDTTPTKLYVFNPDNGQNTEVLGLPAGRFYGIKQMNGLLYISHSDGGVWRYDGVNLAQLTATPFNATNFVSTMVEFGGEMYFGTSSGNVYQSTDGSTFTLKMTVSTSASTKTITDFAVWNGYLYGADVEGYSYSSKIFRTNDGKTWTVVLNSPSFELDGFVAAPDRLYIASVENASWGSFRVRGSTDGTTWTDVIPTTAQGKQLYGRPCYFSQTGTVYYATNFYGDALWPIQNGVAGLAIRPAHGFNSLIEVDGRLFGIGSQSNSNASTSPYVISVLGNYQKTTGIQVTPSSINEGESVTMAGSFIDPGVLDTHTVLIDWGDGSTPTTLNLARGVLTFTTPAHQYFDNLPGNAPYTINVTVTDKDGGVGTESAAVTVTNLAPMAIINGAPATSPTGTPISLTSTVTDPGPTDQTAGFTYSWDVTKVHGATTTLHFATGASANFSFTPYDDGTYTVTLIATDKDGQTSNITRQVVTVPDTTPPSVTNVLVSGTAWTTGFLDYLTSLYSQDLNGYSIPVGSGVQLVTLPWVNIDQIKVVFSEGVVVDQSDLKLSGVNLTDYAFKPDLPNGLPNDGFVYDPATLTATWTLTGPINSDKLMIRLDATSSNAIKDIAGNVLDGEWTNPITTTQASSGTYPSGNGVAGGDFLFRFNVLPGDVTQDGMVISNDVVKVRNALGTTPGDQKYSIFLDVNGDGMIITNDLVNVRNRLGDQLPETEPQSTVLPGMLSVATSLTPLAAEQNTNIEATPSLIGTSDPNSATLPNTVIARVSSPVVLAMASPLADSKVDNLRPNSSVTKTPVLASMSVLAIPEVLSLSPWMFYPFAVDRTLSDLRHGRLDTPGHVAQSLHLDISTVDQFQTVKEKSSLQLQPHMVQQALKDIQEEKTARIADMFTHYSTRIRSETMISVASWNESLAQVSQELEDSFTDTDMLFAEYDFHLRKESKHNFTS